MKKKTDDSRWIQEKTKEAEKPDPKIARLEAENARLSKLLGLVETYHAGVGDAPHWAAPRKKVKPGSATACFQFSDWHFDENVDPAQVGGINAYSREIATMRLKRWADKACEMGDRHRHEWDGALVVLGGDLVSGSIHEEIVETNADYLPGTMCYYAPLIAAALRQVASHYGRVHCPAIVGNHGRLSLKKQAKGRERNSWDWLLVQMIRSHLENDSRFTWDIAGGPHLFVPVYDKHYHVTHGDSVSGGGGWSGIFTPIMTIHRKGMELAATHGIRILASLIHHWHSTLLAHQRGAVVNGAGKGYDEYAHFLGLRPEPAMQNFWAHTPENGVTLAAPIFLEDRAREGW